MTVFWYINLCPTEKFLTAGKCFFDKIRLILKMDINYDNGLREILKTIQNFFAGYDNWT